MKVDKKFMYAIGLQIVILFALILYKLIILAGGTDVILAIRPVDPRDPLRGDYVTFSYDISRIDSFRYTGAGRDFRNGDEIYVVLNDTTMPASIRSVTGIKPESGLYIKGILVSGGETAKTSPVFPQPIQNTPLVIRYGIEEYFIPEGTGQGVSFVGKKMTAKVTLDDNGNAVLKQVYMDGEPWP